MAPAVVPFVVRSRAMRRAVELATRAAASRSIVLVGDAGTGKEHMARWIHAHSPRARAQLLWLDCTERATARSAELEALRWSKHPVQTRGGTIVLLGIDRLHKQLRDDVNGVWLSFLKSDERVQVIATSRSAPSDLVRGSGPIADLARTLEGYEIRIPPLRDRRPDIPQLVRGRLRQLCREQEIPNLRPSADALDALSGYHWPGNVEELEEVLEHAVLCAEGSERLELGDLPRAIRGRIGAASDTERIETLAEVEKRHILATLQACGGNRNLTAAALGIGVNTLWRRLKSYGLARERDGVPRVPEIDS